LSSLAATVGTRGSVVLTVARWTQPHHPKTTAAAKNIRRNLLKLKCPDFIEIEWVIAIIFGSYLFLKLVRAEISENLEEVIYS